MLIELAKKNKQWIKYAYLICKDYDLANDLVQDMYLKLSEIGKSVNDNFVYKTISNLHKDHFKKKITNFELIDIPIEQQRDFSLLEQNLLKEAKKLKFYELELLDMSGEYSYSELESRYNIPKATIKFIVKKARQKIWQDHQNTQKQNKPSREG